MTDLKILDLEWKHKLRFVRIFFDTPNFERITKDKAAKFVDMLAAIGVPIIKTPEALNTPIISTTRDHATCCGPC